MNERGAGYYTKGMIIFKRLLVCSTLIIALPYSASAVALTPTTTGTAKIAVFLYDFKDSPVDSGGKPVRLFTEAQVQEKLFTGDIYSFYKELSYGKMLLTGTVYPWERLGRTAVVNGVCTYPTQAEIQNTITRKDLNLSLFDRIVIVAQQGKSDRSQDCFESNISGIRSTAPYEFYLDLSSQGKPYRIEVANVPRVVWDTYALKHELGHTFMVGAKMLGTAHASVLDCNPGIPARDASCTMVESGSHFDFLSSPGWLLSYHSNAFYKEKLGWIDQSSMLNITQSGTYEISPIEKTPSQSTTGKVAAKISIPGQTAAEYYLEYRQPLGVDAKLAESIPYINGTKREAKGNLDGLFVYQRYNDSTYPLLDMSPDSSASGTNKDVDRDQVALTRNNKSLRVFYDPVKKVSIGPIVSTAPDKISFQVGINVASPPPTPPSIVVGTPDVIGTNPFTHEGAWATDINGNLTDFRWNVVCGTSCPTITAQASGPLTGSYATIPSPTLAVTSPGTFTLVLTVRDSTQFSTTNSLIETSAVGTTTSPYDYDSNGRVDATDVNYLLFTLPNTYILGIRVTPRPCPIGKTCDVTNDGKVDMTDVNWLQTYVKDHPVSLNVSERLMANVLTPFQDLLITVLDWLH